ncbi:uncharacterized protein ACN427_001451 [Glossina fuscipes fuscipes]
MSLSAYYLVYRDKRKVSNTMLPRKAIIGILIGFILVYFVQAEGLSCWQCIDNECEESQTRQCTNNKTDNQCFILFDDRASIIDMGCVGDQDDDFVFNNIYNLFLCNSDNCNAFENIPHSTYCSLCDSNYDLDCASSPNDVDNGKTCGPPPLTQCFAKVNEDGSTQRGCVSDLNKTDLFSCLNNNTTLCMTCNENKCNTKIFPENRLSCHRCNSTADPNCESSPKLSSICPRYSETESCITKLVDDITYRDCSPELACDSTDKQTCRSCNTNDCNVVNLFNSYIGYPGKWQEVPINCFSCLGRNCRETNPDQLKQCELNDHQNCVTVFEKDGTVVQRGCSDEIYAGKYSKYCDENFQFCKFCKSNACNAATDLKAYVDCLFCDGFNDKSCVSGVDAIKRTRSCHEACMTILYPRVDEEDPGYELTRTCLDDLERDAQTVCVGGDNTFCKACQNSTCNSVDIPDSPRLTCNTCQNAECNNITSAQCTAFRENDKCFILFSNGNPNGMGCMSDLDSSFIKANRRQLLFCDGDDCNSLDDIPQTGYCVECNSTNDPSCVSDSSKDSRECEDLPHTQCYMRIDKDGSTHRGCVSDLSNDLFEECIDSTGQCQVCDSNICNNEVYPKDRRSCIRCDSLSDSACEDDPSPFASICLIYEEDDNCVTKLNGTQTLRDCTSALSCDVADREKCRICAGTNDCNGVNLLANAVGLPGKWQPLPLKCYVCEGKSCEDIKTSRIEECEGNIFQTCMTVFALDHDVVQRGCSDDVAITQENYCDQHPDLCLACKSNECNDAERLEDFVDCYFCDSTEADACVISPIQSRGRTRKCYKDCMVALYPRDNSSDVAFELTRTCLNDLDLKERESCTKGENNYCISCSDQLCNAMIFPDDRQECYQCLKDSCEEYTTELCTTYHPQDQCYVLFENEDMSQMGCRSEFDNDTVLDLIKQKKMLLCNGKNCNNPEALPTPKMCSTCSSESDVLCATNPNLVTSTNSCSALPYTDCYTRINANNGHTERGCLAALDNDIFYDCLMAEENELCQTCVGDKCNSIDVFPIDRRKCHQCDSSIDPLCAASPNANKVCPIYKENDFCVTNLANGTTSRGCASSMKCDDENDNTTCRKCDFDGCNTINLEYVVDEGKPGKWQDLPLTCYTCENESQCQSLGSFRVCEGNPTQNCMTIFNAKGQVKARGCSDAVELANKDYCETKPENCLKCNSNGCNLATSLEDYVECLYCDSESLEECVNNINSTVNQIRKCYKHCMTALYARDKEENPAYGLLRSCYDDMDLDDREDCASGANEFCKACDTEKCNVVNIPEKRHSCNICEDDTCKNLKTQECVAYHPEDQCYLLFNETHSVIGMGCRSKFNNAELNGLIKQKRIYLCGGDNCNTHAIIPQVQTCALCNSRTDIKCATNPEKLEHSTVCASLPYPECYSRVLPDGWTERGCLSNLQDDDFLNCLNTTSPSCSSCRGDLCNRKIYPSDRLSCHICDSNTNGDCETSPNSLSICPKYDPEDACVTSFHENTTYRGCKSHVACDIFNPRKCVVCEGSGCNTVNLAKKQDDNFGKWQNLPLTCFTCNQSDCASLETTQKLECELNDEQDCMTVFDQSGVVISRGCSNLVEKFYGDFCEANEDNCYACKSNECNTALAKSEFVDCIYCTSYKNSECLWNPQNSIHRTRQCQGGCMTALWPMDSGESSFDLIRTCLNDKEVKDQTTCSNGEDANCRACLNDRCNVDELPEERHSCYTCEEDCENPIPKRCPLVGENDSCFTEFNEINEISQMGCLSSLHNQELEDIIKTRRVLICSGDDCNSLESVPAAQSCAICKSSDDEACAVKPQDIGTFTDCKSLPYTNCYSKLNEDGVTERGCLFTLPEDDFVSCVLNTNENCEICTGDNCNREIFPPDRLMCYACSSDEDPACESFPMTARPCPIVNETESCVTALSNNITVRDCKSYVYCDSTDPKTCRSCFATKCNSIDLFNKIDDGLHGVWQELPLRCHTCEGDECLHSLGPAYNCSVRNIHQDCMTVFDLLGNVQRRGCSDDVEDYEDLFCRLNPDLCFKCKSNECNMVWTTDAYVKCVFCNSETDASCTMNPESTEFESRKCHKECMVVMNDNQIIRSCLDDKEILHQQACRLSENNKDCAACANDGCNNFVFPSDRLKCYMCDDSTPCPLTSSKYCEIYDDNDSCFAKFNDGKVDLMGCISTLNSSDIDDWTEQNIFYQCEGSECNEISRLPSGVKCIFCDSSNTPDCAQQPNLIETTKDCKAPNDICVTRILEGHTLRGCFAQLNSTEQNCVKTGTCHKCKGDNCNNQIFPDDRRQCYICNSTEHANCAADPLKPEVCPIYDSNDSCVTLLKDNTLIRGCGSQIICDQSDSDNCDICHTDACNTVVLKGSAGGLDKHFTPIISFIIFMFSFMISCY